MRSIFIQENCPTLNNNNKLRGIFNLPCFHPLILSSGVDLKISSLKIMVAVKTINLAASEGGRMGLGHPTPHKQRVVTI